MLALQTKNRRNINVLRDVIAGGGTGGGSGGAAGKAFEDSGNTYTLTNNGTIFGATT